MDKEKHIKKRKYAFFIANSIVGIILSFYIVSICIKILSAPKNADILILVIPFILCTIAVLIEKILAFILSCIMCFFIRKEDYKRQIKVHELYRKMQTLSHKMYVIGFGILWFVFLIVFDYILIKKWTNTSIFGLLFSLIFWITGFAIIKKRWKQKL